MRPLISKLGDVSLALDRLRKGGSKDSWLNSGTTRVIGALECLSTIRNPNVMPIELKHANKFNMLYLGKGRLVLY